MANPLLISRARKYVRQRATATMSSQCQITRPKDPTFDKNTGLATSGTRTTIYTGKCRVWEVTGGGVTVITEEDIAEQNTQISIPWDTSPVPIKGDYIKITSSVADSNLVNRLYLITDQAKSGELRATRRFSVKGVQESVNGYPG